MDEFDFIKKLKPNLTFNNNVKVGIGDDAAIYRSLPEKDQVVCVDTMVEGIHFLKNLSAPQEIGYKALAVNLSDIAAMGATPLYYLVSIAIPQSWNEAEVLEVFKGMEELAQAYELDLIGGDTVSIDGKLVITVTVIGEVKPTVRTLRNQAKDDDVIFVTGSIGDSAAGLAILLNQINVKNKNTKDYLVTRHKKPTPRIKAGHLISCLERSSLNDISDGLASELHEIAEASKVGMTIFENKLPASQELLSLGHDIKNMMLFGGEDFELVGTTSPRSWEVLKENCKKHDISITKIGIVTTKHTNVLLKNKIGELEILKKSGYNHFKRDK